LPPVLEVCRISNEVHLKSLEALITVLMLQNSMEEEGIIISGDGLGQEVLLHASIFSNMRLYVPLGDCWIVVREGAKGDSYEEERLLACQESAEAGEKQVEVEGDNSALSQTRKTSFTHYTYMAFQFRKAYFKVNSEGNQGPRMAATRWAHHITLAYLPARTRDEMRRMAKDSNELLADWFATKPDGRPLDLLTSRSFLIGRHACDFVNNDRPSDYDRWPNSDVYTSGRSNFLDMEWGQICELVDNNLLSFVHEPNAIVKKVEADGIDSVTPAFVKGVCAIYWRRDRKRMLRAHEIEEESRPKYHEKGAMEIFLRDTAVSKCSEVRSLLHYLHEMLVFKWGVYHMQPTEDLGLHNEDSWHVTPQTNGLHATRQGLDTPAHANYVECYWPSESFA
jgi:hypothetical protein